MVYFIETRLIHDAFNVNGNSEEPCIRFSGMKFDGWTLYNSLGLNKLHY